MRRILEGVMALAGIAIMVVGVGCACCPRAVEPTFAETPVEPPPTPAPKVVVAPMPTMPPVPEATPTPTPQPTPVPTPNPYVEHRGPIIIVKDVTFDSGSTVVKPEAKAALAAVAGELNDPNVRTHAFTVTGHTDNVRVGLPATIANLKKLGKSTDNQGLSEARAESVAAVLKAAGVDASRMTTAGKGASEPVADNKTPEGRSQNRRVEIRLEATAPALRPAE